MLKRLVIFAAVFLFAVWMVVHWDRVSGDADAVIRFSLGCLFALLIILRRKDPEKVRIWIPDMVFPVALVAGTISALVGIVFRIHMIEWAGVLVLLVACCLWVVPKHYRSDIVLAFLVLFWIHPLPGQVFGWLQGWMQRLSVRGSEILLHTMNVRVWGDGIVLRTGYQNFLVPEACSGMRTSVTVFLCALGVGLLLKLKWYETIFFVVLGLLQVLLLNITRISFMVIWAPRMPPEWADEFLHDTLGIFLMIGIALVQFEAGFWCWWSRRRAYIREAIERNEIEPKERASIIPHPLRQLMFWGTVMAGVGLIGFGSFVVLYKMRVSHRKAMIYDVAEELLETDVVSAERAVREMRQWFPDDRDLLGLHANAKVLLGRFSDALAIVAQITDQGHELRLEEVVLKSWALSRDGRLREARARIDALGPRHERIPGVAMLKAEFAAMDDAPAEVSRYIVFASVSRALLPRVRALYPYLAAHEQWGAIVASDHDAPYGEIHEALIALHANQQMDHLSGLVRVMRQTLAAWPDDYRLLGSLFEIAMRRQSAEWNKHFENNLRANLDFLDADALAMVAGYCWRLERPDLAWLAYLHLERVSPYDPELLVAPVQHASEWTRFRRQALAIPVDADALTIDVRPLLDFMQHLPIFSDVRNRIPQYDIAAEGLSPGVYRRNLERSLAELSRLKEVGELGLRLARLYAVVLARLGHYDEAHAWLDQMLVDYPEIKAEILIQHAVFFSDQQRWVESYENLRAYHAVVTTPRLSAYLLEASALMNMNMAVAAMDRLAAAERRFPGAERLDLAASAIWDVFGFKYQALHILRRTTAGSRSPAAVDLLEQTHRNESAERLRLFLGFPQRLERAETPFWLPPADLAVTPRWPAPPDDHEIQAELRSLRQRRAAAQQSPFVSGLLDLQIAWYANLAAGEGVVGESAYADEAKRWASVGRTSTEQAAALYQLAMYAARQKERDLALIALANGGELLPRNPAIWRSRLALAGRENPDLVDAALTACPNDPEIFLAALVSRLDRLEGSAAREMIEALLSHAITPEDRFAVETLVRAGNYLLSQGWRDVVVPLARVVERRADDLVAAHVFVILCAMTNHDGDWAIRATLRAIPLAVDKVPFYRVLAELKIARREFDSDLLGSLEYLHKRQPEDSRWSEVLGSLYFERGDLRRALSIFGSLVDMDIRGVQVQTLLLAAETARLENRIDQAVRILESAHALQPEQPQILNNLVYMLAKRRETLGRAYELLPRLLELGGDFFAVLDTAAVVAMRVGDLEQAEKWMEQALALVDRNAYGVYEMQLNLAELQIRQGRISEARNILLSLRQDASRPDYVDQRARRMLRDLDVGGQR